MSLKNEFQKMVTELTGRFSIPPIADVFFPPFDQGGQPKDSQFMALSLEGGAAGDRIGMVGLFFGLVKKIKQAANYFHS